VATGDPALIPQELAGQHRLAAQHGLSIVFEQEGGTLPGPYAQREHFGFKDGISQPLVRGFDEVGPASSPETGSGSRRAVVASGEFIMGYPRQGQSGGEAPAPPSPAWMHNGAFQVFRRLRQDVSGWREQVTRACQAQPPACRLSEEVLMAKLIGRWQNGVPLAQAAADSSRSSPNQLSDNDFDYEDDPYGYNTPRFAHIRKMYPRINSFIEKEWHRIIRRSVPYGPIIDPQDLENAIPDSDRGLLFNAYMASIEDQFEFLQQGWANDPDFLERGDGPDPLIGTADAPITLRQPAGTKYQICLQRVVHTTGSLYTFVPSLAALRSLADVEGSTRCATSLS
jgi:Dyp-type peroxidase family